MLVTALLVVPSLSTAVGTALGLKFTWVLIGESTWATFMSMLWSVYFASHVVEKHGAFIQDADYNKLMKED